MFGFGKRVTTEELEGNIEFESKPFDPEVLGTYESANSGKVMQLPAGLKLSSPTVREWIQQRREQLKPWASFLSTSKFVVPQTPQKWTKRVIQNVTYFQSNYMFVSIGLIIYCLITSPLLLIAVAATLGAYYIVSLRNGEKKLQIFGKEITLAQQYAGISIASVPLFYIAGATTALFWVLGASFFLIILHASLYNIESILGSEDQPFEDLQMEEV